MITEDYVSFEIAKLLKEKGFDGQCLSKYNSNGCIWDNIRYDGMLLGNNDIFPQEYLAPTLQMAMKWLREVHNIAISVYVFNRDLPIKENETRYTCTIATTEMSSREGHLRLVGTYEQACEAGIKYCLENLI